MAFIITRINVGDYDRWKPMFDQDAPGARSEAEGHRILRNADAPNEVFLMIEFASTEDAQAGRKKLLASGVLDRFDDKDDPKVFEHAEQVDYDRPTAPHAQTLAPNRVRTATHRRTHQP